MNYNCDQYLWENKRQSELAKDPALRTAVQVVDGHICYYRECLARFSNTEEAEKALAAAGWVKDESQPGSYWRVDSVNEFRVNIQCVPHGQTEPKTFISKEGSRVPVSPCFNSLYELYPWMRENRFEFSVWVNEKYVPGRVVKDDVSEK